MRSPASTAAGLDSLLSRVADIFFGIPLILGAIVLMQLFADRTIWTVVGVLALFGWPQMARIARGAVISAKNDDLRHGCESVGCLAGSRPCCATSSRTALGPDHRGHHHLARYVHRRRRRRCPSSVSGCRPAIVSWGGDISTAQVTLRRVRRFCSIPATALAITVLGFIMMGDALRDALDPKSRKR